MNYFNKETTVMYQHGGTAGLGAVSNQRDSCTGAAAPQRRMEGCLKRFEHLLSCYADIANQLESLASNFAGTIPEPAGTPGCQPAPTSGLIGQLEGIADQFDGRMQRIQSALRRLQEL